MEVNEEGGALVSQLERMGWGYGRIIGGVGGNFQVILYLRWEMAPRLDSGMIYGVRIWPLKKPFQVYLVLLAQRMLLLQIK